MGKAKKLGIQSPDDLYKAVKGGKVKFDELSNTGKQTYKNVMQEREGTSISPSGTTNAGFRQLEAAQTKQITQNAAAFKQTKPNFLNPFVPEEAVELRQRKSATFSPASADDSTLKSFGKRLQNQQYSTRLLEPIPKFAQATTGNKVADTAADLLGFGLGLVGPSAPGAITSAGGAAFKAADQILTPVAPKLSGLTGKGFAGRTAGRAIHGGTAGTIYGATEGITQGKNPLDVAKTAVTEALTFAIAEPIFGAAGDTLGAGIKALGRRNKPFTAADIPAADDLFIEAIPESGEYSIKYPPKKPLALPEGTGQDYTNMPNWEYWREPAPRPANDFTVGPLGRTHIGETQFELPAGRQPLAIAGRTPLALPVSKQPLALPESKIPNWEYWQDKTIPTGNPPIELGPNYYVDSNGIARTSPDLPKALPKGLSNTPSINLRGRQGNISYPSEKIVKQEMAEQNPGINYKRSSTPEIDALNKRMSMKIGPFRIGGKVEYAPEAAERPEIQAADTISKLFGARGVIPIRGTNHQGINLGRQIYLNDKIPDPVMYVSKHEIVHTIETTDRVLHAELMNITRSYATEHSAIVKHYTEQGYTPDKVWEEFNADILSEVMDRPDFWAKVRESSPQAIQKVIDVIDQLITKFKQMVDTDQSMLKYISDLEAYRDMVAPKIGKHLNNMQGEKQFIDTLGKQLQKPAAKLQGEPNFKLGQERSRIDDLKDMVLAGAKNIGKGDFKEQMLKQFPQVADEAKADAILKYVYDRASELNRGQTVIKLQGQEVPLSKKDLQIEVGSPSQSWNHVVSKTTREPIKLGRAAGKVYSEAFDDLTSLKKFDDVHMLALNSRESGGTAKYIVEKALVNPDGTEIGQSLASITKQIPKGAEQNFENYLVYRHAPSWLESGKQVFPENEGITADIARQRAAAYERAHPEFKQIADNLIQWQKDLKKTWLVDTGIIKPEEWEAMSSMYPDYVPLRRRMKDIEQGGLGGLKKGFANQSSPLKKATGSQREIINPLESIIEDTDRIVKIARHNGVMQYIDRNIRQDPQAFKDWIEILPEKGESFESAYVKDGIDGFVDWLEEPFEEMIARKNIKYDKPNIIRSRINGETVHYQVNNPEMLNALTNLTPQASGAVTEFFRQGSRIMKMLTTGSNPVFATRNMARDLPMAYISSDTLTHTPVAREIQFAWGIVDGFARIVTNGRYDPGQYYKTFKALGGGSHSSAMASDRNLLAESKAKILPGYFDAKKPLTTAGRGLKAAGRGVEAFTNAGETIPRLPEYVRTVKAGKDTAASRQLGLARAQDVTVNFSKHGNTAKDADAFIPYLNAALQGIDKIGRIYASNPIEAIQRSIVAISVPAITLWAINHDDPNYNKLSSYVKDNYFCIPVGGGKFLKVAKPREAGVVFGSLVERALNKWGNDDPEGFKGFSEAWIKNFAPPTRWLGAPMTDVIANKNFAGSPIVPGYQERLSPELQYDENTSAPAKALGKLAGLSPKKADYVARSYTGVIGELGIPAAAEGRGESAGQRVGNVLKKTFIADPLYSNDIVTDFYNAKDKLDTANSDFRATNKKSNGYNPAKARIMNHAGDRISDLNRKIREVNQDKSLTYEEKDKKVKELKQKSQEIAKQALRGIASK